MVGVLCPLKMEYEAARPFIERLGINIGFAGHGKVNFAIKATQWLIENPEIKTLICLGAGGGLNTLLSPGDVVVASKTIEHDYKEMFNPKAGLPQVKGHEKSLALLESFKPKDFQFYIAPIASGDEDIIAQERVSDVVRRTQAMAVGWEGIGGAKACRHLKRNFLEIRGITDLCTSEASQDFKQNLQMAMKNGASLVEFLISQ